MYHQPDLHRQQVDFLKDTFVGWIQNLQKDAYAQGGVIEPEVIAEAFKELREYYDILDTDFDLDEEYKKLLGEQDD